MGFFEDFNNKVVLGSKRDKLNEQVKGLLLDIGTRYYIQHKDETDGEYAELIANVNALNAQITELEVQLNWLKGIVVCQNCHAECQSQLRFCTRCGAMLVKPVQEPQPSMPPQPPVASQQPVPQNMGVCPSCGNRVSPQAAFCTQCGRPLR